MTSTSEPPLIDSTGLVSGLLGIGIDITERKRIEREPLRPAAVESARDAIVITSGIGFLFYPATKP